MASFVHAFWMFFHKFVHHFSITKIIGILHGFSLIFQWPPVSENPRRCVFYTMKTNELAHPALSGNVYFLENCIRNSPNFGKDFPLNFHWCSIKIHIFGGYGFLHRFYHVFGYLSVTPGSPLAHFWSPLASKWLPLGSRWLPFGSLLAPLGSHLHPLGSLWLTFGTFLTHLEPTCFQDPSRIAPGHHFGRFWDGFCMDFDGFWASFLMHFRCMRLDCLIACLIASPGHLGNGARPVVAHAIQKNMSGPVIPM